LVSDYELWERHIHQGLQRCGTYELLDGSTRLALVVRRVDDDIHNWWNKEMHVKGIISATWFDLLEFLRVCFVFGNKPRMHVKVLKQPLQVVSPPAEDGKRLQLCSKEDMVVSISFFPKEVPKVVPVQTVAEIVPI
jgi:hypothetical protein